MYKMPKVNIKIIEDAVLNEEEMKIVNLVVKKNMEVRASKPKVKDAVSGKAAYVWRMVVFTVSPKPAHQCMPMTADFDLPAEDENGNWKAAIAREMSKELDKVVDIITNSIPKEQWYSMARWSRAFYGI